MRKNLLLLFVIPVLFVATPVHAGHDHGSMMAPGASHGGHSQTDEQTSKEGAMLVESCARKIASLERHISRLQVEQTGKPAGASARDELKLLEEKLKEANEIARSLRLF